MYRVPQRIPGLGSKKAKIIYSPPFSGRQATALAIFEPSIDLQEEKLR